MKNSGEFIIFILILCICFPSVSVGADDSAVAVSLSYEGDTYFGGELTVIIKVGKPATALAALEFMLYYDSDYVTPIITENSESGREMDSLVSVMPTDWEQLSYHSAEEEKYHFRFAESDTNSGVIDSEGDLVLAVPFRINSAGSFDFSVSDSSVIAISNTSDLTPLAGKGGSMTVVADSEAQKIAVKLQNGSAIENGIYNLNLSITNLGDNSGIIAAQLELKFDDSIFEPTIINNNQGQMDVFLKSAPKNAWEQMCSFDANESKYILRFAAKTAESVSNAEALEVGRSIEITIPFRVIGSEGVIGDFSVASGTVLGLNNLNGSIAGNGSSVSISVEKGTADSLFESLGYELKDGYLLYVLEKTDIEDFLKPFDDFYLTNGSQKVDSGYVKNGYILTDGGSFSATVIVKGDADGSGEIGISDYVLIARTYMGTFFPTDTQLHSMTITNGKTVVISDYVLVCRHYFGTYIIK